MASRPPARFDPEQILESLRAHGVVFIIVGGVAARSCYHQYCDEPASRCQVDHIKPWSEGGMTDQYNGRLACGCHNRLRQKRPPPPPPGEAGG